MTGDDRRRRWVRHWWRYALEDLRVGEQQSRDAGGARWACLAAQQAAEKAIKAVLVAADVDFPRTHDLERLLALLPRGTRLQAAELDLAGLSGWSVAGRYPGNLPDATFEDAEEAVAVAATIVELAREDLRTGSPEESSSG
jgi:HEPN domain-containing protein